MKIIFISDTHGHHRSVRITKTDILIHSGDVSGIEKKAGAIDFLDWFSKQPARYKILVAGNHDASLRKNKIDIPEEVIYLQDSGINIEGLNIWGSPLTRMIYSLSEAFNDETDELVRTTWNKIPLNTDMLNTHMPPKGILDINDDNTHKGCPVLFERVMMIKPLFHAFGHIHEAYGVFKNESTTFVNASVVNIQERPVNQPIIIELHR
jgi:Icc-related predicted phosphoesterase